MNGVPKILDFLFGIIIIAGGLLPVLVSYGVIGEMPTVPNIVLQVLVVIGGLLLLMTAFKGTSGGMNPLIKRNMNLIVGLIVLAAGAVSLLVAFGVVTTLPAVPLIVLQVLMVVGGLVLFLDGIVGASNSAY